MQMLSRDEFEKLGGEWLAETDRVLSEAVESIASFLDRQAAEGVLCDSQAATCKATARERYAETLATARQDLADAADRLFGGEQAEGEATE